MVAAVVTMVIELDTAERRFPDRSLAKKKASELDLGGRPNQFSLGALLLPT